ncbi:MAG: DUF2505 domain-containing protein [Ornithinimicrobium sp.]|jgi:hypothetical protein|uniref:DUF2505 domain-containing protein n=1 Tax=Ornithinimicrobium sp. TaxID=1977084 RepID=UPI0017E8256D|nr:DUF2505 domain-containing protein [Actinomycetota bacterium]
MRITERIEHSATPDQVHAMLVDPAFQEERCRRSGSLHHDVEVEATGEGSIVVTRREMPTDDLPDVAKRFVGSTLHLVETMRWGNSDVEGDWEAAYTLDVESTPVSMVGGIHLLPDGPGTVHSVDGELSAHVPLVGGRIERAVRPLVVSALELEARLSREWLNRT